MRKLSPEKVRGLRERNWMSQQDLADAAGFSLFTIQRIERGDGAVRPGTGRAIARALSVTPDELTDAPKAEPPRERPVEPTARGVEGSEPDALAGTVRRLSAWGREVADSEARSDDLQRDLELIDDMFDEVFRAYRSREGRGGEAGELARAIDELVGVSDTVADTLREAAVREANPGREAHIVNFLDHRRNTRPPASLRAEVG